MKIVHVINSLVAAGAENLVVTMANAQVEEDEVSIFTFYSEKDVFHKNADPRITLVRNRGTSYFSLRKLSALNRLIKSVDVVHVHLFPPFYLVGILSIFHPKTRFIYTEHNTHNSRRKRQFRWLEKWMYSRYASVVCITNGVETKLKEWAGTSAKTTVINNVVHLKKISETIKSSRSDFKGIDTDDKVLVMIGRFHKQKDQDTIIRAMNKLPMDYKLLLIGEGPREKEIHDLVVDLKLESRVHFLGVRTDVFSILKMCDYGVISSHWEGFGIVALEYMACGLPTIGSNVEGLNEVIPTPKALFQKGNASDLSELILKLGTNQDYLQDILDAQRNQIVNFDVKTSLQRHIEVYNKK